MQQAKKIYNKTYSHNIWLSIMAGMSSLENGDVVLKKLCVVDDNM